VPARLKPTGRSADRWTVVRSLLATHRTLRVLLTAFLMFAAVFSGRMLDASSSSGLTVLYVLPVVFVAVELGRTSGILAGVVALGLFSAWAPFAPNDVPISAYLTRGITFVIVGAVAGHLADRLHVAMAGLRASARHFELARDLLCTTSFDGYMTQLNGSWEKCLGWTREELMARPFIDFVHPDDRARTMQEAARAISGGFTANFTNRYRTKDGEWRWIEWSSNADRERQTIYAAARDVTERTQAEEQLRYLADHDPLSGVYNRRRFEQELYRELEHSELRGSRSAVLLLDVDAFKTINDTLGHGIGDAVIARIGETLRYRLRTSDVIARLGGDEFAVLLRRVDLETAVQLGRSIQALTGTGMTEVAGRPVTMSIGLATITAGESLTVDEVMGRADRAMYTAKRQGGNALVVSDEAESSQLAEAEGR